VPPPPGDTVVIIDPPRAGCSLSFLSQLVRYAPERIVYVSCNVETQARDIEIIVEDGRYRVARAVPFDLFPQTRNIESVVTLVRKDSVYQKK
jgi:tRNA/tmRNA/rRNA uracil-C5-methylase (TrmA/RlmC/RlmD family)